MSLLNSKSLEDLNYLRKNLTVIEENLLLKNKDRFKKSLKNTYTQNLQKKDILKISEVSDSVGINSRLLLNEDNIFLDNDEYFEEIEKQNTSKADFMKTERVSVVNSKTTSTIKKIDTELRFQNVHKSIHNVSRIKKSVISLGKKFIQKVIFLLRLSK